MAKWKWRQHYFKDVWLDNISFNHKLVLMNMNLQLEGLVPFHTNKPKTGFQHSTENPVAALHVSARWIMMRASRINYLTTNDHMEGSSMLPFCWTVGHSVWHPMIT